MAGGRSSKAGALASRALAIWEGLDAPDAPEFATVLALSAQIQMHRGDYVAAAEQFRRALQIRSRVFGSANPLYAEAQSGLSVALARVGDGRSALDAAVGAEATGRKHLQLMLRSLPEREALNYATARPKGLSLIVSLIDAVPEATSAALDALIRSRALVLDEMAARRGAGAATTDAEDPAVAALTSARQRLANLIVPGPGQLTPAQYRRSSMTRAATAKRQNRKSSSATQNSEPPSIARSPASTMFAPHWSHRRRSSRSSATTGPCFGPRMERRARRRLPCRPMPPSCSGLG